MLALIHFNFCPFCQRVRLALGYKQLAFNEIDARFYGPEYFLDISGFDRLPVIVYDDGTRQSESMEIIADLDRRFPETSSLLQENILPEEMDSVLAWRTRISGPLFRLLAPVLTQYPGLGDDDRAMQYYRPRMETWLEDNLEGLSENRHTWYAAMLPDIEWVTERVTRNGFFSTCFSAADALITADLTGLRMLKDIELPAALRAYFSRVEDAAGITLLPGSC